MNLKRPLTHADLLQLKRWNTPTICNGWEQVTRRNPGGDAFNLEETRDRLDRVAAEFSGKVKAKFKSAGEW